MDLRKPADREFLQLTSIIVNRSLINLKLIKRGSPRKARLVEKVAEDVRRLYRGFQIWQRKSRVLTAPEVRTAVWALLRESRDIFVGALAE